MQCKCIYGRVDLADVDSVDSETRIPGYQIQVYSLRSEIVCIPEDRDAKIQSVIITRNTTCALLLVVRRVVRRVGRLGKLREA